MNTVAYEAYIQAVNDYNSKGMKIVQTADLEKGVFVLKFKIPDLIAIIRDELIASHDGTRLTTGYEALSAKNIGQDESGTVEFELIPRTRYKIKGAFVAFANHRIAEYGSDEFAVETREVMTALLFAIYDTENTGSYEIPVRMNLRQHVSSIIVYLIDTFASFFQLYMLPTNYEIKP